MNKRQLIEAIMNFNPTAKARFLSQFDEKTLQQYLANLQDAAARQQRSAEIMQEPEFPIRNAG